MKQEVFHYDNLAACHFDVCTFLETFIPAKINETGGVSIALSGGKSPAAFFKKLSSDPFKTSIPWHDVSFFWSDERCLDPDHPDSNYRMAMDNLLIPLAISQDKIFRMPAEQKPFKESAGVYEKALNQYFHTQKQSDTLFPKFDLIFLGMGPDGHTASLFPDHLVLQEKSLIAAVECDTAVPPVPRLTFTLPLINNADTVLFMVNGEEKCDLVQTILKNPDHARNVYPAAMIHPQNKLLWFLAE